jgi:hypothetical protein
MGPSNEDIWILDFGILDVALNNGNLFGQWWIDGFLGFWITNIFVIYYIYIYIVKILKSKPFHIFVINGVIRIKCKILFT